MGLPPGDDTLPRKLGRAGKDATLDLPASRAYASSRQPAG